MEFLSVRHKSPKSSTSRANKKIIKPLKIVYISNPVRFTASPDQFRAVVQHLTGRHSTAADDLPDAHHDDNDFTAVFPTAKEAADTGLMMPSNSVDREIDHERRMMMSVQPDYQCHDSGGCSSSASYGDLEAVFEMFDGRSRSHASELFVSYDSNRYEL